MDKAFRRRVYAFIIITLVTAGIVWIYMHKNQHSRSRLTMLVPAGSHWYYNFQTRQIEDRKIQGAIPYFDSLKLMIPALQALAPAKDRGELGIDGHSDIILFETEDGWYACLALTSEPRMLEYLNNKVPAAIMEKPSDQGNFYLAKAVNHNLYFAFKHKACMFYVPMDTANNSGKAIDALKKIFDPKAKSLMGDSGLNQLYDAESDVIFWNKTGNGVPSHGVNLAQAQAKFIWPGLQAGKQAPSPLLFFKNAGLNLQESDVDKLLKKNNSLAANDYLNLTFKTIYQYLKPYTK